MSIELEREVREFGGLRSTAGKPVPLDAVAIEGEVLGGHAHVRVRQSYVNVERDPIESVYTFPLPSDATLTGFRMECEGRRVEGVVREREQAFRAYDDAVLAGHGAALLEQERKNVFTATVGNLLPGERTVIEVEYVQRVQLDEGSMRVMIPTLVAPRYIPGAAAGARTAHGTVSPTNQVPDADRITPPLGATPYRVTLDLLLDLGRAVQVRSPSHAIAVRPEGPTRARVGFAREEEPLDRDIVLEVRGAGTEQLAAVCAHKPAEGDGYVAISVLPDLFELRDRHRGSDVTFLIDTSGSMEGPSIEQARAALRLCLRHLREGDRFNVVAFESQHRAFSPTSVPFSQRSLEQADAWVASLHASGGTELLAPMIEAATGNPRGIIVLLTDGQVGNEEQIVRAVLARAEGLRVYSFGIGTNVSDQLLRDLARTTRGAVEFIHPGERIEEKVVSVFARAIAPRVSGITVRFEGLDVGELSPAIPPPLVDAEPWILHGRYERGGTGRVIVRGTVGAEPWTVEIPLELPDRHERPTVARLWAAERIRDLEAQKLEGRRADAMKARIIELSTTHGVASAYTSFVVVEKRTGDRRAEGRAPATRVVPVNAPAGWAMMDTRDHETGAPPPAQLAHATAAPASARKRGAPPPAARAAMKMPAPAAPMALPDVDDFAFPCFEDAPDVDDFALPSCDDAPADDDFTLPSLGAMDEEAAFDGFVEAPATSYARSAAPAPPAPHALSAPHEPRGVLARMKSSLQGLLGVAESASPPPPAAQATGVGAGPAASAIEPTPEAKTPAPTGSGARPMDPASVMSRQLASGLWSERDDHSAVRETALALHALLAARVTTAHPMYGTPVKKAVEALLVALRRLAPAHAELAAFALGVAWLIATGPRTRRDIEAAAGSLPDAARALQLPEADLRRWLDERADRLG